MTKGQQRFWQFACAAVIAFPVVGVVVYCAKITIINTIIASTPLVAGAKLPSEITKLVVTESFTESVRISGVYHRDGHEIRFFTARGPAISAFERASGAGAFEISVCFIDADGHTLVTVAGGDGIPIPECNLFAGEALGSDDPSPTTEEEMGHAREAMQAIAKLSFRPEYEPEQKMLTATLALAAIAEPLDRVLLDTYGEQPTGEVIIGPDEMAEGRGIHLP